MNNISIGTRDKRHLAHLTKARLAKVAGCCLLVSSLSVQARDFDTAHIEIDDIHDRLNERLTTQIEQRVNQEVRAKVRQTVEDKINDAVIESVSEQVSTTIEAPFAARTESVTEELKPVQVRAKLNDSIIDYQRLIDSQLDRIENQIDIVLNTVQDQDGNSALANEWLIMTDKPTLRRLIAEGYLIKNTEELAGLGYVLGTVRAPTSFSPDSIAAVQILDNPQVVVDLNHVYLPQRMSTDETKPASKTAQSERSGNNGWSRIGMIDSSIDQDHDVFARSEISEQSFTPRKGGKSLEHGTAIASILVGSGDTYQGLSPTSELYNGVVFATDEMGREFSTTAAIVRAINWLATSDVKLINMSLAGPDNAILRQAISSACARGITIVTAAGNAGPASAPLYPAAYDCTIAVTAIDESDRPYHRANRGDHIDYALPGVNVHHAASDNSYFASSGTSFAAAQLTGLISSKLPQTALSIAEIRSRLDNLATDIGQAGRDPVFGQGAIRTSATARISE